MNSEATDVICRLSHPCPLARFPDRSKYLYDLFRGNATGLDPPLILYFPRLFYRTIMRLLRLAPPCSPGCEEMAAEAFFSRNSILWWYAGFLFYLSPFVLSPLSHFRAEPDR